MLAECALDNMVQAIRVVTAGQWWIVSSDYHILDNGGDEILG